MEQGDIAVIWLIIVIAAGLLLWRLRRWLMTPRKRRFPIPYGEDVPYDAAVELLEGAGFDVVAGKTRIPLTMTLNDSEQLESRLFIDYYAMKDEELFLVKLARERRPLDMTGSAVRDMLLPYFLLYPDASGVLYVDLAAQKIKKICFHIEV